MTDLYMQDKVLADTRRRRPSEPVMVAQLGREKVKYMKYHTISDNKPAVENQEDQTSTAPDVKSEETRGDFLSTEAPTETVVDSVDGPATTSLDEPVSLTPNASSENDGAGPDAEEDEPIDADHDSDWEDKVPRHIANKIKRAMVDPKHPELGGIISVRFGPRNDGKLKSRYAADVGDLGPSILGAFLGRVVTGLIGGPRSGATKLGLAIAQAVAAGEPVLGVHPEPATVLYVDPVRPPEAIAALLTMERSRLDNLRILGRGKDAVSDDSIKNEIENLKECGSPPRLVIVNEIGRFTQQVSLEKFAAHAGTTTSFLIVAAQSKYETKKRFDWESVNVVDMTASEKVLTLQPDGDDAARLSVFEYGELVDEFSVEPKANWKILGKPEEQIRTSRQAKVLAVLKQAGKEGLSTEEVIGLLGMEKSNVHVAMYFLRQEKKGGFLVKGKYYAKGFEPEDEGNDHGKGKGKPNA